MSYSTRCPAEDQHAGCRHRNSRSFQVAATNGPLLADRITGGSAENACDDRSVTDRAARTTRMAFSKCGRRAGDSAWRENQPGDEYKNKDRTRKRTAIPVAQSIKIGTMDLNEYQGTEGVTRACNGRRSWLETCEIRHTLSRAAIGLTGSATMSRVIRPTAAQRDIMHVAAPNFHALAARGNLPGISGCFNAFAMTGR